MQIIPGSSQSDNILGFYAASDTASSSNFYDAMQSAMDAVSAGENHSVDSALAEAPVVDSPYSKSTTDGVTYTLDEVCFTKNELAELREQLIKEGAPVEALDKFDILASQPDGATLAQVLASLMGSKGAGFSEDDAHAITALLGQIDPSGTLAEDALTFMRNGNGRGALELIRDALGGMAADQAIDIDPETLAALGRGLGLNQGTINNMVKMLGGNSLSLSGEQFGALLDPADSQLLSDAANAQKLDAALEKTLKAMISKARDRMQKEQEAAQLESRRVQQSRILIDRTVQEDSRANLEEALAGQANAEAGKAAGVVGRAGADRAEAAQLSAGKADRSQAGLAGKLTGEAAENAQFAANTHADLDVAAAKLSKEFSGEQGRQGNSQKDAWSDLLGKVEVKPAASNQISGNSFVYSMLQGDLESQIMDMEAQLDARMSQQLNRQLAAQVEQGMLTAMRDGGTRLDLQLHPQELGALTITLVARNGEVTARLRSEKPETAEMLQRQADIIRVNLEQQGVKVDKIEVQLEDRQGQNDNAFADLGGHNARQEENARRQELQRMRNLATVRNNTISELAQGLHNMSQSARYAGNALHVVA